MNVRKIIHIFPLKPGIIDTKKIWIVSKKENNAQIFANNRASIAPATSGGVGSVGGWRSVAGSDSLNQPNGGEMSTFVVEVVEEEEER